MRAAAAAAGLVVLVVTAGCGADRYEPLRVGQCLPAEAQVVGRREAAPPAVWCNAEHLYEVYAVERIDRAGTWPGEAVVDRLADELCQARVRDGTGIDPNDPPAGVKILRIQPTEQSWNTRGDRSVECLLRFAEPRRGRFSRPDPEPT